MPDQPEELTRHEKIARFLGFLSMIVLTLGVVFLAWDYLRSPERAEAAPMERLDDRAYVCSHQYAFGEHNVEVIGRYCANLAERGL